MGSPTLQTLQDPILLLPWVCFRRALQTLVSVSSSVPGAEQQSVPPLRYSVKDPLLELGEVAFYTNGARVTVKEALNSAFLMGRVPPQPTAPITSASTTSSALTSS
jgi:hypothetical protein